MPIVTFESPAKPVVSLRSLGRWRRRTYETEGVRNAVGSTLIILAYLLAYLTGGCAPTVTEPKPVAATPTISATPEPWVGKPASEWPQLLLTNEVRFRDGRSMDGASSFLIEHRDRIYLGTARHLLGPAGGVDPAVPLADLDDKLESWTVFPRAGESAPFRLKAGPLAQPVDPPDGSDWLVLAVPQGTKLPSTPLKIRTIPVRKNERLYLIGCPYSEADCRQNVYPVSVTKRSGDFFVFDLERPVEISGFSGGPIVDRDGLLVGVFTLWFEGPRHEGTAYLEGGGEDAGVLARLLQ